MSVTSGGFYLLDPEAASVCSDVSGSTGDDPGEVVLALERKSVQPYKTQDEYLYAMMEDLSDWFNTLYDLTINPESFFEGIETGMLLCKHANAVQDLVQDFIQESGQSILQSNPRSTPLSFTEDRVRYKTNAKAGTFLARDNISNFLSWCVRLGIPDDLRFETEDLVNRRHERNVILCLLEVARRGAKYGMLAPVLIQLEEEIDRELAGESPPPPPLEPQPQRQTCDLMSLDEMVRDMVSRCTCPSQFPMVKVSDGKYKIGDSQTLIFVRILRNHVMVRIGGGWDTLENYLNRHDPCRCHNKGHKPGRSSSPAPRVQSKRRASAPNASGLTPLQLSTRSTCREAAIAEAPDNQVTSPTRRTSVASSTPARSKTVPQKFKQQLQHSSPSAKRRHLPTIPGDTPKPEISSCRERSVSPTPFRPQSARTRRDSELSFESGSSREDLLNDRLNFRPKSALDERRRMSELRAETKDRLLGFANRDKTESDMFTITRGDSGRHTFDRGDNMDNNNPDTTAHNGVTRTLSNSSNRFHISPDKLLPNKMTNFTRSTSEQPNGVNGHKMRNYSVDSEVENGHQSISRTVSLDLDSESSITTNGRTANHMTRTWSHDSSNQSQSSSTELNGINMGSYFALSAEERKARFGSNFTLDVEEYPDAPPEDIELNRHMEQLFEEFRAVEKGTIMSIQYEEPTARRQEDKTKATTKTTGKPNMSKVNSRIKEYLEGQKQKLANSNRQSRTSHQTPTPRRSQTPTPRRSTTPMLSHTSTPRRSQTPNPSSYKPITPMTSGRTTPVMSGRATPVTSGRTTPTTQRRNLPETPSSQHDGAAVRRQPPGPRGSSTAWQRLSRSTTDLTKGLCDTTQGARAATRPPFATHSNAATPRRPQSARPVATNRAHTPMARPTTPLNTSTTRRPTTQSNRPLMATDTSCINSTDAKSRVMQVNGTNTTSAFSIVNKHKPADSNSTPARRRSQSVDRRQFNADREDPDDFRQTGSRRSRMDESSRATHNGNATNTPGSRHVTHKTHLSSASAVNIGDLNTVHSSVKSTNQKVALQSQSAVNWSDSKQPSPGSRPLSPEPLAKPRKDKIDGLKTKIPQPLSGRSQSADLFSNGLKRYDSGVDINNMSPTESSIHGDEDVTWPEGVALTPQVISCLSSQARDAFADDDGEFF